MGRDASKREKASSGGVLGPNGVIGLPAVRTLCDEYRDTPEPEDSESVPAPAPPGPGRQMLDRLVRARPRGDVDNP